MAAFGPDAQRPPSLSAPHGKKRRADTALETEQRLSKRLDLLNLENNRLYIPVPSSSDIPYPQPHSPPPTTSPSREEKKQHEKRSRAPAAETDSMQIEETPHRIYIHDLSAELADLESDEETPIFLSDIEKHIAKIPAHVLAGPELKPTKDNQLVLYSVPSSLTVPEEQDRVRKAIIEARARLRQKQGSPVTERVQTPCRISEGATPEVEMMPIAEDEGDPDAMDIDD